MISSRTPEGEPLECRICGQRSFVLLSDPARDSVCPNCGCFSWIALEPVKPSLDFPIDATAVTMVVDGIARCDTVTAVASRLDTGLREILRPDAIVIWTQESSHPYEKRLTAVSQHGECGGLAFVREVLSLGRSMSQRENCLAPYSFTLGLPWLRKEGKRSIGAIELSYIREVGEDAEVIIERVAKSLAVVAASQVSRISCGN